MVYLSFIAIYASTYLPDKYSGGILAINSENRLICVDIGESISSEIIQEFESRGNRLLFNCAAELFNSEYLIKNIDKIIEKRLTRIIDQDKEFDKYISVKQITQKVLKLMKNLLILTVDRSKIFLSIKLFVDMLLNSNYPAIGSFNFSFDNFVYLEDLA